MESTQTRKEDLNSILTLLIAFFVSIFDRKPYWYIIKKWCEPFNITIKYTDQHKEIWAADPDLRMIFISRYNKSFRNKREYLYSVAHELGHLVGSEIDEEFYMRKQRISNRINKRQILADEIRAWNVAEILLRDANLYHEEFCILRDRCLKEYQEDQYDR